MDYIHFAALRSLTTFYLSIEYIQFVALRLFTSRNSPTFALSILFLVVYFRCSTTAHLLYSKEDASSSLYYGHSPPLLCDRRYINLVALRLFTTVIPASGFARWYQVRCISSVHHSQFTYFYSTNILPSSVLWLRFIRSFPLIHLFLFHRYPTKEYTLVA